MARNEDGDYELILGNGQLLSLFVILVVLLGIFFSMGYIAGKNGGTSAAVAVKPADGDMDKAAAEPAEATAPPPATNKASAASGEPPAARTRAVPPPEERPAAMADAKPAAGGGRAGLSEPEPGQTFLQVVATGEHDAQTISDTLQRNQFPSRLAPGPKGLVRVLVGPVKSAADLARLRTELEAKGFSNPFVQKY